MKYLLKIIGTSKYDLIKGIINETESQVGLVNLEILNICSPVTSARIYKT